MQDKTARTRERLRAAVDWKMDRRRWARRLPGVVSSVTRFSAKSMPVSEDVSPCDLCLPLRREICVPAGSVSPNEKCISTAGCESAAGSVSPNEKDESASGGSASLQRAILQREVCLPTRSASRVCSGKCVPAESAPPNQVCLWWEGYRLLKLQIMSSHSSCLGLT